MPLTVRWHIGAEAAGDERLDTAPEQVYFYLVAESDDRILDSRTWTISQLRDQVRQRGDEAPQLLVDALLAADREGRQFSGAGPATPDLLRILGIPSPTQQDRA